MQKRNILLGVIIIAAIAGYFIYTKGMTQTYRNDAYGISFSYPRDYVLQESERGNAERGHYAIVLVREEDSAPVENGEGPTAITFDVYHGPALALTDWLHTSDSNYKLALSPYSTTTVADAPGVLYAWSGLYQGITTAFVHRGDIIAASVTLLTPNDENARVYQDILDSLRLY
jgi:hypothetical protein